MVGLVNGESLSTSLMPLSLGVSMFLGDYGVIIMTFAAILAFITTANVGILTASRNHPKLLEKTTDNVIMFFVYLFLRVEAQCIVRGRAVALQRRIRS